MAWIVEGGECCDVGIQMEILRESKDHAFANVFGTGGKSLAVLFCLSIHSHLIAYFGRLSRNCRAIYDVSDNLS